MRPLVAWRVRYWGEASPGSSATSATPVADVTVRASDRRTARRAARVQLHREGRWLAVWRVAVRDTVTLPPAPNATIATPSEDQTP
jgi:hypothetical protein